MQVTHLGKAGVALAAVIFAATACSGGGEHDDSLAADSGAVNSASGDVAGANMATPAMVVGFLTTVNTGEIEAGQLATDKATNAQVKQYAQMMVTDHRRANQMVDSTAGNVAGNPNAPAGASAQGGQPAADVHAMHQQAMQSLQNTPKGRGFDSTYIALMIAGHQDVLTRLESMRGTGGSSAGGASGAAAGGTAGGSTAGTQPAGTANPGAVGSTGTTQSAGAANQGDMTQTNLQSSIEMVRRHLERAQEIQRTLQGSSR